MATAVASTWEHLAMSPVGGQHVEAAVGEMSRALRPHTDADWLVRAGSLDWTCWETATHVAHDLIAYAGQIAGGARPRICRSISS